MTTSDTPPSAIENPVEGLTIEWIMDRRIVVYTIRDVSRTVANVWMDALESALASWTGDKPFLALYDVNFPGAVITPYARSRLSQMIDKFNSVYGRTAVVLPRSFTISVVELIFRARARGKRQRRIFTNYDQALNWLKALL
jgi:hypothetical protein